MFSNPLFYLVSSKPSKEERKQEAYEDYVLVERPKEEIKKKQTSAKDLCKWKERKESLVLEYPKRNSSLEPEGGEAG
jgi:hypothetical protein